MTCSDAAALELLEPKYRRFKVRLIPDEGLAITAVESRHYPDRLIPCRRDAIA
ncbi:MAG: hypothetical protein WBP12_04840 [Candidatus Saccharimonas sp.]